MKIVASLLSFLLLISCTSSYKAFYDVSLDAVERPQDATEQYGKQLITKVEGDSAKYSFSDDLMEIIWLPANDGFFFDLTNKTDHSIKIIWDEAVYINRQGQSMGVIHYGIKYTEKSRPQAPSVVARGTTLSDVVFPKNYVSWGYESWVESPLWGKPGDLADVQNIANVTVGENVKVLLPLQIEDTVNEYIFNFKFNDFEIKEVYYYGGWHIKP